MAEEHWSEKATADADKNANDSKTGSAVQNCPIESFAVFPDTQTEPPPEIIPELDSEPPPAIIPELDTEPPAAIIPELDSEPPPAIIPELDTEPPAAIIPELDTEPPAALIPELDTEPPSETIPALDRELPSEIIPVLDGEPPVIIPTLDRVLPPGIIPVLKTGQPPEISPELGTDSTPEIIPELNSKPTSEIIAEIDSKPSSEEISESDKPPPVVAPKSEAKTETAWIEFQIVDDQDQPLANEPCTITLADGTVRKEKLGADGKLRIEGVPAGACKFSLPNRKDWEPAGADGGTSEKKDEATSSAWIEAEVTDDKGLPMANESYKIVLPDGKIQEGKTDAQGRFKASDIAPGSCKITFPDRDGNSVELDNS